MPTINIVNGNGSGIEVVKSLQKYGIQSSKDNLKQKNEPASSTSTAATKERPLTV